MTIFVGSTNPVKINAVKAAAEWQWPDIIVTGFQTQSGVKEQPYSDEETKQGAHNRAASALKQGLKKSSNPKETYLAMGLEGGVFEDVHGDLWSTVWAVLLDTQGNTYESNGSRIKIPELVAARIKQGGEMGPVMEALTGHENVRQNQGMFGIITKDFVNRTEEYAVIAKTAIGLWYGRDWDAKLRPQT